MSNSASSPTARLLQHSRLFSLPRALPAAVNSTTNRSTRNAQFDSNTATAPYPTHQVIETPYPFQRIGDWGVKRSLPLKTTNKGSAPKLRILAHDTSDQVTNFARANDHERTLAKFQEMALPIVQSTPHGSGLSMLQASSPSVFEDSTDITDSASGAQGWKSTQPWLGGLASHELKALVKGAGKKKETFTQFVSDWRSDQEFDAWKTSEVAKHGFFGPFECLDWQTRRTILLNQLSAAQQNNQTNDGQASTLGDQSIGEHTPQRSDQQVPQSQSTDGIAAASLRDDLAAIEYQISRLKAAQHLQKAEAEALEMLRHVDENAIAVLRTAPESEQLQASVESDRSEVRQNANALVEKACERLLSVTQEATEASLLSDVGRTHIASNNEASSERRSRASKLAMKIVQADQEARLERERQFKAWKQKTILRFKPNAEQLNAVFKNLRDEHRQQKLSSNLTALLVKFLNLPGFATESESSSSSALRDLKSSVAASLFATDTETLPLTTHPSAGIGYLRSNANMVNHPIFGPQAHRYPVLARVVRPRASHFGNDQQAKLGVGGFVTNDPKFGSGGEARKHLLALDDPDRMVTSYDPANRTGNKLWVQPTSATVDETGRVQIKVLRAAAEAVAVKTGDVDEILARKRASRSGRVLSSFSKQSTFGRATSGSRSPPIRATTQ